MKDETDHKDRPVVLLIGLVLLLTGLYGTARTVVNVIAFEKYPLGGVLNFTLPWSGSTPYVNLQREGDCATNYYYLPPTYYQADNVTPRPPTDIEKQQAEVQKQQTAMQLANCVSGVKEARDAAKV